MTLGSAKLFVICSLVRLVGITSCLIIIGFDLFSGSRLLSKIFTSVNSQYVSFKIAFEALIFSVELFLSIEFKKN